MEVGREIEVAMGLVDMALRATDATAMKHAATMVLYAP